MEKSLQEFAIEYAQRGWKIFPLSPKDKRPLKDSNGFKDATDNIKQIKKWWSENPNYNIGMATGSISGGIVVIDLDKDKESGKDGYYTLKEWERENNKILPDTVQSITGRNGNHLFYKSNAAYDSKINIYDGVDIRAENGYVVLPPSIHPNGNKYEWEYPPGENEITEINEDVDLFIQAAACKDNNMINHFELPETISQGNRNDTIFKYAASLRTKKTKPTQLLNELTKANKERCNPPLKESEITQIFDSVMKYPEGTSENQITEHKQLTTVKDGKIIPIPTVASLQSITAADLVKMDIPPLQYRIDGLLPTGLAVIGAAPKMYKSYMALDVCISICNGTDFLGHKTHKAACLYLDLESSKRRPRDRICQLLEDNEAPSNLYIIDGSQDVNTIGNGLEKQLEKQLEEHPDIKLIVIDVFKHVRPSTKKTQTMYDKDYEDAKPLQAFAQTHDITILIIHHTRQLRDKDDPFNELGGSNGLLGALDCAIVITKNKRSDSEATLHLIGRDMESKDFEISFNTKIMRWEYHGTTEEMESQVFQKEYDNSNIIKTIKKLVKENNGTWQGSASDIKTASMCKNIIDDSPTVIGREINKFEGILWAADRITFTYKTINNKRIYTFKCN